MSEQYIRLFNMDDRTMSDVGLPESSMSSLSCNRENPLSEIRKLLLELNNKIDAIATKTDRLTKDMISIRSEVSCKVHGDISIEREVAPRSPFTTFDELNSLEEKLKNEEIFKKFANKMYMNGEKSCDKFVRNSWRSIFTDNLARQCSWRGTATQKCIRGMLLTLAIRSSFTKKFALEESEFDRVSQKYFQYAHDRVSKVDKYLAAKQPRIEKQVQQETQTKNTK